MSELVHKLGIDWKLLIASIVNFFILFFILRKYAYGPILGMLEKREKMIADSVDKSATIEKEFQAMQEKRVLELTEIRAEASLLMEAAAHKAERLKTELVAEAKAESAKLMATTKSELERERQSLKASVRAEVADLVVAATEKVLTQKLTGTEDRKLVERTLEQVERGQS